MRIGQARQVQVRSAFPPAELRTRRMIRTRAMRTELFDSSLFSDPAWDILLDLFLAELEDRKRSLVDLTESTHAPQSTVARWLVALENCDLVLTRNDETSSMDLDVKLTSGAVERMRELVRSDGWM